MAADVLDGYTSILELVNESNVLPPLAAIKRLLPRLDLHRPDLGLINWVVRWLSEYLLHSAAALRAA